MNINLMKKPFSVQGQFLKMLSKKSRSNRSSMASLQWISRDTMTLTHILDLEIISQIYRTTIDKQAYKMWPRSKEQPSIPRLKISTTVKARTMNSKIFNNTMISKKKNEWRKLIRVLFKYISNDNLQQLVSFVKFYFYLPPLSITSTLDGRILQLNLQALWEMLHSVHPWVDFPCWMDTLASSSIESIYNFAWSSSNI